MDFTLHIAKMYNEQKRSQPQVMILARRLKKTEPKIFYISFCIHTV